MLRKNSGGGANSEIPSVTTWEPIQMFPYKRLKYVNKQSTASNYVRFALDVRFRIQSSSSDSTKPIEIATYII